MADPLAVLLISGTQERAHYAFVLAAAAAATGRAAAVFATNAGCHALMADWSGLADAGRDATVRARGVAGLEELRDACRELGVRLMACSAGLLAEGLSADGLLPGVEVAGVPTLLDAARGGPIVTL